ncbi:MAG: flagellar basal body P-ring formation protein FlgA [Deltaproteobacteria bacterium]|nr:flagellar basal body P-ring formation protein FlgA [Deltaproteobacteria bacterium]NCP77593.1 flagellar basal body P-ring formation protein FlgA [Desulfuromonadales bacterium]
MAQRITTLCLLLICLLPGALMALELPLQTKVEVSSDQVVLRDLLAPVDADRLDKLSGEIRLFRAPEPGMHRVVSRETLARLVNHQIDAGQLRLSGAAEVTITRRGIWIEPADIEMAIADFLAENAARFPDVKMSFENISLPARFLVPAGAISYEIIPSEPGLIGSRRLTLLVRVDDQIVKNQSLRVELVAHGMVATSMRDLKRGDVLSQENLSLQTQDISQLRSGPFFALDKLLGKELKRHVRAGEPLQESQVDFPPLIERGSRVTIQAQGRGLLLTAFGEARQNGELGDSIRVRNNNSQREIRARVLAAGLVSVEF